MTQVRAVGRYITLWVITAFAGLSAAACGSAKSGFDDVSGGDASMGGGNVHIFNSDGSTGGSCAPKTCADWGYTCGQNTDGCGNLINCGTCTAPAFCGGGGYSQCGTNADWEQEGGLTDGGTACVPKTCADLGFDCGYAGDGCGNLLDCGGPSACTTPQYCGGGGPQKCGGNSELAPDGGAVNLCTPTTCAALGFNCGYAGDGCGNQLNCGGASACASPEYCGGSGPNVCGGSVFTAPDGGTVNLCTPTTCTALGLNCGYAGDGCGNQLNCGGASACASPEYCGGGGPNVCGGNVFTAPDGGTVNLCTPKTCAQLGYNCGFAGDGCGNQLNCGGATACPSPEYCGGGGPNICGGSVFTAPDGGTVNLCTPTTCAALGYNCGFAGDGCGNQLNCGGANACPLPEYCGGGGANKCGGSVFTAPDGGTINLCTPKTCAALGYNCGQAGDGCGNVLSCGSCSGTQYCGGGGANVCGGSVFTGADGGTINLCKPTTTCASLHFTCGQADDGCGNVLNCGTCTLPQTCGGGGVTGQCGETCVGDAGLCQAQKVCDGGTPTTITGQVLAGLSAFLNPTAGKVNFPPDPVPNVLVYIPNSPVAAFTPGAACRQCGDDVSGSPLVSTYTNFDGTFTLQGVPTPASSTLPLVIQLGRWRRQFTITTPTACTSSQVSPVGGTVGVLNLPRNHTEGDIPLTAVSTGDVDALECVLMKMGVDQAEFTSNTPPAGTTLGRIHIYAGGNGSNGGNPGANARNSNQESALMDTGGTFMNYDQILFPCWGGPAAKDSTELADLVHFADNGGHFFATHYSYSWLIGNGEFNGVANWDLGPAGSEDEDNPGTVTWDLNVSTAVPVVTAPLHAGIFYEWLNYGCLLSNDPASCTVPNTTPFAASPTNPPQVAISNPRFDADSVANGSIDWIDGTDQTATENNAANPAFGKSLVEHFTFNTPVGATSQCGHAIYSDFHVSNVANANGTRFPGECPAGFSPQEKVLEYMLFDLASCVSPPTSNCTPLTCAEQGLQCGQTGDGCGNTLQCGTCTNGETCGGGGTAGLCGQPDGGVCTPKTCALQGFACGPAGDGCGNLIQCGSCPTGKTCGGGGAPGQCGSPDGGACTPKSCALQGFLCGPAGDGCGNEIQCGTCTSPLTCGGGGVNGHCGEPDGGACTPRSCASQHIGCGPAGDGCGNAISCGGCPTGQTCGGGGVNGQCGAPDGGACTPQSCAAQNIGCGPAGDGCGNAISCGGCSNGLTCGGGGVNGQCGAPDGGGSCVPETCASQHIGCGPAGDGCGNAISCGGCPTGLTCGGGGTPGQCGAPDGGGECVPETCAAQSISCGPAGDGCGNAISCGGCPEGQTCGGSGASGQCGEPDAGSCTPQTCAQQQITCGPAGDGCGNLLQCGTCTAPQTCGGGGVNGQCGGSACVPLTCAQLGLSCGPAGDGCGGLLDCGSCPTGESCGGGGTAGVCGSSNIPR